MRELHWSCDRSADDFFPKCHFLSNEQERDDFIDDFRWNAAANVACHAVDDVWSVPKGVLELVCQVGVAPKKRKRKKNIACL